MCLYPQLIKNPKYKATKKNGYKAPLIKDDNGNYLIDPRTLYVPVGCGNCIECRKQKARQWQVRINEEQKKYKYK